MIKNIFKVSIRYLAKHKGYTIINITGLAVGIAVCILIMLFVRSEWSFNSMHSKEDRIYRAWLQEHYEGVIFNSLSTPIPLGPLLTANLPEVEMVTRVSVINPALSYKDKIYSLPVTLVDSTFFEVFDFELIEGNRQNPFPNKNSIIITREAATVIFGSGSPIGENLELEIGDERKLFNVTGLAKDPPNESTLQFNFLIPFSNAVQIYDEESRTSGWTRVSTATFVLLKEGVDARIVDAKIPAFMDPLVAKMYQPGNYLVRLQPLSDIHFNTSLPKGVDRDSNPLYSYILASVGILILLIACINFITLSTGRSTTRAMEVGVRKVLGAEKKMLIWQFWGESLIVSLFALLCGLLFSFLLLEPFNQLANREFIFSADAFTILFLLVLLLGITVFAGGYPALVLSSFQPIKVLKGQAKTASMGFLGKSLVIGQFVAAIVMIICTVIIGRQLNYIQSRDLGFKQEHIIVVPMDRPLMGEGDELAARYIKALEENPQVINVSKAMYSMAEFGWMELGYIDDRNAFRTFSFNAVDDEFIETMNMEIVQGRSFIKNNAGDSLGMIVNEALVREYGWENPIGKKLPGKYPQEVIGVVKDFHFESLHTPILPAVMALKPSDFFDNSSNYSYSFPTRPRVSVKFREGNLQQHLAFLESTWKAVAGNQEFQYRFLDDALAAAYEQEQRLGKIVKYVSLLSIFIACLGLFGLSTLVVARRTKELGIRKVLGANVGTLMTTINRTFAIQILIASLIAFPLAWLIINRWMRDFEYRIEVPLWVFAVTALMVLVVALLTVSIQSFRAANRNPVDSLRSE